MWEMEEIIEVNKGLGGNGKMVNEGSLDFAISAQNQTKDWLLQLAYLARAILVDHTFSDYNKRTTAAVLMTTFEELKIAYDSYAVDRLVERIARKRVRSVKTIRSMIRDVIR